MSKHRFKLTQTFRRPTDVQFEVEFDTETGEAEVVGDGRVVASEDHMRRREIISEGGYDDIDEAAYLKLLEDGTVKYPDPGSTVHLHGDRYVMDIDPEDIDPEDKMTPEGVLGCLVEEKDADTATASRRRQRSARRHFRRG